MAFGSDRSANFVIAAKDAATKPIGNVGKAMGKLKSASITAFKAIAAGAAVAAAAITAFVADAIKGAMEDERSTILTNAALKARGFELDKLKPKIEEQIKAAQRLGIADDRVRAGLEVGSRYFKNQERLLKANSVAATISAATGENLESVMRKIGKAVNGQTRGLADLIGPIEKGAKFQDILTQATAKYQGVADELANSTSGRLAAAQETFNEAMDDFGAKFLPVVADILTWLTEEGLPAFQRFLDETGPIVESFFKDNIAPLAKSVGDLFALFDDADFSLLELALAPVKLALDAIKVVIDLIVAGLKLIGVGQPKKLQALDEAAAAGGYTGGSFVNPMNRGGGTPITTNTNLYLDGALVAQNTSGYLATQTRANSSQRSYPRNP